MSHIVLELEQIEIMIKLIPKKELYTRNIIGVKLVDQIRIYRPDVGYEMIHKKIKRTKYLKVCWMCSATFESYKVNAVSCGPRCAQNIWYARKIGLNPPARMDILTKEKNTESIRNQYNYK